MQTPNAQNIENRKLIKCTITLDLFCVLHQSTGQCKITVSPIFSASLYALRSLYRRPTIVECVSLVFKYLFYCEFYRNNICH